LQSMVIGKITFMTYGTDFSLPSTMGAKIIVTKNDKNFQIPKNDPLSILTVAVVRSDLTYKFFPLGADYMYSIKITLTNLSHRGQKTVSLETLLNVLKQLLKKQRSFFYGFSHFRVPNFDMLPRTQFSTTKSKFFGL
jgi:hypothetical protein